jgi:hypothetical protein
MNATAVVQNEVQSQVRSTLTKHAVERMERRGLSSVAIAAVIGYGRVVRARGAEIHAIGRKEVEFYERTGIHLSCYEGIQVVCSPDGAILTVYRNRNFRGLRPRNGRRRYSRWSQ